MNCPQCGTENPPDVTTCRKCTTELPSVTAAMTTGVATGWSASPTEPISDVNRIHRVPLVFFQPGDVIGKRYEVLHLLGEGGMGAVYKVRDRELERFVALKVIRPELAARPEILQRFKQELILARQVTHKNVIRIFDLGEADSVKFITMEFIEGQDLKSLLRERGKLPPDETVKIMAQVCRALEAAHNEGVVHRDLKPQNIMLDSQGRVTVMDFGIARSTEMNGMTQTGAFVGTPEYMSPEQAMGEHVDARSDLFTLGIIFYELLTGDTPFRADTFYAMLLNRTTRKAKPPIETDPSIPQEINEVVVRCLETSPDQRYQSAREILAGLGLESPPATSLRPMTVGASTSPVAPAAQAPVAAGLMRRYGRLVAGCVAALLLVSLGAIFWGKRSTGGGKGAAGHSISLAILPFRNASGDASLDWLGPSLAEMLSTDVGQASSVRTVPPGRIQQVIADLRLPPNTEFDPETLKRIADFSTAGTLVWGQYAKVGDQIRIDATLQDTKSQRSTPLKVAAPTENELLHAVQQLAESIQQNLALSSDVLKELRAKSLKPSSQSLPALRFYNEGLELARQGNQLEAAKRFEASIQADPAFAMAYSELGLTYSNLRYDDKAEQFARKAVDLSDKLPPQERYLIQANYAQISNDSRTAIESYENLEKVLPDDMDVHFHLGGLYESTGAFDKARNEYAKVLAVEPKRVDALLAAGRVEIRSDNPQASLDFLNRALSLAVEFDNTDGRATILNAIGFAYKQLNKPEEALRNYQDSLALKRALDQKPGIAITLGNIAQVQSSLGKPEEAYKSYQEAVKLQREIGDKKGLGTTLINLGDLYTDRGRFDDALESYKESLQIQRDVGNENNQALCLNNIGTVYLAKGQSSDALTYFERALELRKKGNVPSQVGETLHNLAEASLKAGDYGQSLDYHLQALDLFRSSNDKSGAAIQTYSMGTIFEYQGRYGAALKSKEEALKTFRELKDRSFWMAEILSGYGHSLSQVGRYDEAQKILDEGLSLARQLQNKTLVAQTLNFQGDAFYYQGDLKSAEGLFSQALAASSGDVEKEVVLLSKFDVAKCQVAQKRYQAAVAPLKAVVREADASGLKYLSTAAQMELAEALIGTRQYPAARKELNASIETSQKLGLQSLLARSDYLLGRTLELTGNKTEASTHYADARRILDEIRKESGSDAILKRQDLAAISSQSTEKS